ncbi:MAG: hypothetical protein P8R54_26385 [Myxococcota bacterium]|nr:hypothetical protein [Myxococcota bacterium]
MASDDEMFRARRMALTELVERIQAERSQHRSEEGTVAAILEHPRVGRNERVRTGPRLPRRQPG